MKEEFRWIKGFEGYYMVSNLGRIYSFPRYDNMMRKHGGYFISTQISPNGYEIGRLYQTLYIILIINKIIYYCI